MACKRRSKSAAVLLERNMYADMDEWTEIRKRVLLGGESKRAILRETDMHWRTLEKILAHSQPPGYRQSQPRKKPMIGPQIRRIDQWRRTTASCPRSSGTRPSGSGNGSRGCS